MPTCKVCDRAILDAKRSDAKYHPECRAEYKRKWHQENKERNNQRMKELYYLNRDARLEAASQYRRDNNEKVNANNRRRREVCKRVAWASRKDIQVFHDAAKHLTKQTGIQFSVDHIIPIRHELVCGLHCPDNLQILSLEDNIRKGNSFTLNAQRLSHKGVEPSGSKR